jgi:hypothetical protein
MPHLFRHNIIQEHEARHIAANNVEQVVHTATPFR